MCVVRTETSQMKIRKLMKVHHHTQTLRVGVRFYHEWIGLPVKRLICHSIIDILGLFMIKHSVCGHLNVPF